jgi:hypothetical protein
MGGSAMAAALAAQEASRRQRRLEQEIERRRERRRAQRMLTQADHAEHLGQEPERHAFACAAMCLHCGFLAIPTPSRRDPMRSDARALAVPACACERCGRRAWADLAVPSTAEALREFERREIELRSGIGLAVAGMIASGAVAVLGVLGAVMASLEVISMAAVVAIGLAFVMFTGRRALAGLTTPRRLANRWRAPTRASRLGEVLGRGTVRGAGTLRAPLSDRTVLAWRVEVRYPGDRGDAFALVEQDCVPMSVAGVAIEGEPTIATAATTVHVDRPEIRRYLMSRGIDPDDLLEIRERIVQDGATVAVQADRRGGCAVLVDA